MDKERRYSMILKKILLILFLAAISCGCTGSEQPSASDDEGPSGIPSLVQGPLNAKEDFYKNTKLLPIVDGYSIAMVSGVKVPADEGPGLLIDYMAQGTYVSDSGDVIQISAYDLRTGVGILIKKRFEELQEMEVDGTKVYLNDEERASGKLDVQWQEGGIVYVAGADTLDTGKVLEYAGLVMKSTATVNPDAKENEWMLLYQYLPEPPEDENLYWIRVTGSPITSLHALYATGEMEYTLSIITGEGSVMVIVSEQDKLSSAEDVQIGGKTGTAGYSEGKYKIVYIDEEKQIGLSAELETGNLADASPALVRIMEAAMEETGLV
jgi:hypothetical protein